MAEWPVPLSKNIYLYIYTYIKYINVCPPSADALSEVEKYTSDVVSNMSTISNKPTALTKKTVKKQQENTQFSLPLLLSVSHFNGLL